MIDVSDRVARELYPISLQQARGEVRRHALVLLLLAALAAGLLAAGERDPLPLTIGMLFAGLVAFILDLRWWLWLRHADPVTAYDRLQTREERERSARGQLAAAFSLVLVVLWYAVR